MKQLCFIFITLMCSYTVNAQNSVKDYVGTWRGEKGDTVFTVKLLKGKSFFKGKDWGSKRVIPLFGGYSIAIKGKITDDYLIVNTQRSIEKNAAAQSIYIVASYSLPPKKIVGFTFYDQRKKHLNGEGILGGTMEYISPDKLHWTLNEKEGIWYATEGSENAGKVKPIGFSVPSDIILKKVVQ